MAPARIATRSIAGGALREIFLRLSLRVYSRAFAVRRLTLSVLCSITYTLLPLTNQTPVQPLPISYVNNVLNWLRRIRAAIRCDKSRVASALNLPISPRSSGVWNLRPAKPPPSLLPMNWVLIRICFWRWPAKSLPNFKPSFVDAQNYSLT
jgi:hypothetical protein